MDMALSHWSASWPVLLGYVVLVVAHLTGLRRVLASGQPAAPGAVADTVRGDYAVRVTDTVRGDHTVAGAGALRTDLRREAAVFHVGLLTALLALASPVGYWATVFLWVRAVQSLMLAFVAPALIVLGAPWLPLRQSWRASTRASASASASTRASARARPDGRAGDGRDQQPGVPWLLARPVAAAVVFNAVWLGWQAPVLADLVHTSGPARFAECVTYLAAGIGFWLQLIGSRPFSPPAAPLRRVALVVGTVIAGTVLGMVLVFGSGVLYPVYGGPAHHIMTVIDDQQLAGAVLWMGMLPPVIIAAVALFLRWLSDEESAELSAGLDRLVTQRKPAWASRSGVR